jgi:hypothetical protein
MQPATSTTPLAETYEERLQAFSSFEPPYAAPWWLKNQHVKHHCGRPLCDPARFSLAVAID